MAKGSERADEYIIVLEYQPRVAEEALDYGKVRAVVEELREWHPTALFSPDRYALQLQVIAWRPTEALRRALDLHERAVHTIGAPLPALARVEVLTGREFDSQWDDPRPGVVATGEQVLSDEIYWATRALLRAATATELTEILIAFVAKVGGRMAAEPAEPVDELVSIDVALGDEDRLYAVAERCSVSGLILEHSLPTLVADARAVLNRGRLTEPVADELGGPGNRWHRS